MSVSYTLSDIAADFGSGAKHVAASASPFLELEFGTPPRTFKSTMVKHGGPMVAWQQPVLLTGATSSRLVITAKSHKSLLPDTTIGTGTTDLAQAAAQRGPVIVPLSAKTGHSAGQVQFVVTRGEGPGVANLSQPQPDPNGVVEGVGGPGRNIEGGSLPSSGGVMGGQHHGGPGVGAGAALGAAATQMGQHHDHNRGAGVGMGGNNTGNNGGMGGGPGMGQQHLGGPGMGAGAALGGQRGMMPQGGQQGGMVPQGGQQGGMGGGAPGGGFNNGQQMVPGGQQQGGGMGGGMTPQETYEKHAHNVHDHSENETFERRNIG